MGKAKDALKLLIGSLAERTMPQLGREVDAGLNTARAPRLKRAILYARVRRAHARGDVEAAETALAKAWRDGHWDRYHVHQADSAFELLRDLHAVGIEALTKALETSGKRFTRLVEIGCGDGRVLVDWTNRLPSITQAVGIDLSASVVRRASAEYGVDRRFTFVNVEAREWLTANPQPGTVVLSNNGVLEYFSPEHVDQLLQAMAQAPPVAIVLIEPVANGHDLATDPASHPYGNEYAFSHNHRSRLTKAGFEVVFEQEVPKVGLRMMTIVALRL